MNSPTTIGEDPENECLDEYDNVASGIVTRVAAGQAISEAIKDEFEDWFAVPPEDGLLEGICQFLSSA